MDYSNEYNPQNDGVLLFDSNKLQTSNETAEAFKKINMVLQNRPKSIIVELNTFRKYVPSIIKYAIQQTNIAHAAVRQNDRFVNVEEEKKHKRWTENEDKLLIDLVCEEKESMMSIATIFGRSVTAIKARLTYLVGVKRLSQQIAGKFIGTVNGEESEVQLEGTLYKG